MTKKTKNVGVEARNQVHSNEAYKFKEKDSTAKRYSEHCDLENNKYVDGDSIIDRNKAGKVVDVTDGKEFKEKVAYFTE